MKKKIIIYTTKTCQYCKEIKELLDEENIKFIERNKDEFTEKWHQVVQLTNVPIFPTVNINDEYFVPNRDFQNSFQLLNIIKLMMSKEYKEWDLQVKIYERLKTINYSIHNQLNNLNKNDE